MTCLQVDGSCITIMKIYKAKHKAPGKPWLMADDQERTAQIIHKFNVRVLMCYCFCSNHTITETCTFDTAHNPCMIITR